MTPTNSQRIDHAKYPPSSLVQIFSADEWECFIEDCCRVCLDSKYKYVQQLGGAGDGGRDIEARYVDELEAGNWDLYQAKKYSTAVGESVLYPELAKVVHHIAKGTYPIPRNYYVCAPKNTTPKLHDLIASPEKLKVRFLDSWEKGGHGIDAKKFPFTDSVKDIVLGSDFFCVKEFPVKDLIELHSLNPQAHEKLFGIEMERGDNPKMPIIPADQEATYVTELVGVYSEHAGTHLSVMEVLGSDSYSDHFGGCRGEFYCAEGLKRFSRDILPGEFEKLLESVHIGVKRVHGSPMHRSSMEKVDTVLDAASKLQVSDNPLSRRLLPADLPGACHHLVNEERLKWVK